MSLSSVKIKKTNHQLGFTYFEVILAMFILAVAIVPAMDALQTGIQGAAIHQSFTQQHYAVTKRMETVMVEPFSALLSAAQAATNASTPSSYSDAAGSVDRVVVLLSFYDAADSDGDGDPFTIADADSDGDTNPYTGGDVDISLLWQHVEVENTAVAVESLITR